VWYGKIVDRLTFLDNLLAGKLADTIVAYRRILQSIAFSYAGSAPRFG